MLNNLAGSSEAVVAQGAEVVEEGYTEAIVTKGFLCIFD